MFTLDVQSRLPIYEQLKNNILRLAALGVLQPHEQLPSVRSVARQLGINPNTVQKAYAELEREGVLYSMPGKGSFLSPAAVVESAQYRLACDEIAASIRSALRLGVSAEQILSLAASICQQEEEKGEDPNA